MKARNYPELLANKFRFLFPATAIYSNVDPSREWNGINTIEFIERETSTENYITGATRRRVSLSVATRAETQEEAARIGQTVKELLSALLDEMRGDSVESWTKEDEGTTPDARGLTLGESFYWYFDFKITEPKEY